MATFLDETITEPQQAAQWIYDKIAEKKDEFGINFLGLNERLKPQYPAVVVLAGAKQKALHQTHIFIVGIEVVILVYHAKLDVTHTERTEEDLDLVTQIENWLETGDMTMDDSVVFMYVASTTPTIERGTRYVNDSVVGTQMVVAIESRKGFPYGIS
ncbi:MAG TPA: hypothetical protein VGE97_09265 [Nitrososphaera sp.]|jgi:hypothetical protein